MIQLFNAAYPVEICGKIVDCSFNLPTTNVDLQLSQAHLLGESIHLLFQSTICPERKNVRISVNLRVPEEREIKSVYTFVIMSPKCGLLSEGFVGVPNAQVYLGILSTISKSAFTP